MLTQTEQYALKTVLSLARRHGERPARVGELAQELGIPKNYLSKTLHQMARAGILNSTRGKLGGFELRVPPAELRLVEVLAPFGHIQAERRCLLGGARCSDGTACEAHAAWKPVAEMVSAFFRDTTVADLLRREPRSAPDAVRIPLVRVR